MLYQTASETFATIPLELWWRKSVLDLEIEFGFSSAESFQSHTLPWLLIRMNQHERFYDPTEPSFNSKKLYFKLLWPPRSSSPLRHETCRAAS